MKYGVDYASARADKLAELRKTGIRFVCRYLSTVGNPKNLTLTELIKCRAVGLEVVTVFETLANRALYGEEAGKADARAALAQLPSPAMKKKAVVYFAVDFDASASEQTVLHAYFAGAVSVLGRKRVGVYGGYWVVKRLLDSGIVKYAWQTLAWSGGAWDKRAQLRQTSINQSRSGVSVDLDQAVCADYGQWPRPRIPRKAPVDRRLPLPWRNWRRLK